METITAIIVFGFSLFSRYIIMKINRTKVSTSNFKYMPRQSYDSSSSDYGDDDN